MTLPKPRPIREQSAEAERLELNNMSGDDHDHTASAPLIAQEQHYEATIPPQKLSSGNIFVWALTVSACVSGLLFGYDTGVISSTLVSIGTDLSSRSLTTLDKGLITSCTSLFALIASPIAGVLADRAGRKRVILVADALFTFGAIWQALSNTVWAMIIGRSVVGLAIGGASLITPLYISELAPGHLRGRLVTVSLLFITGGQVVAYVVGWLFSNTNGGWRWMVGLGAVPSSIQLALLFFMPETPRYLARIGKEEQAKDVLRKVYRSDDCDTIHTTNEVLLAIKKDILEEENAMAQVRSAKKTSILPRRLSSLLLYPPHARALAIACLLQGFQQLCGFNSLMYFSASIFDLLQFSSPTLTSLSIAVTNFIFTVVAFYLIDRVGRRRILLITVPIMVLGLLLCALAFTFIPAINTVQHNTSETPTRSRLPALAILFSLLLYVSSYATGLGPVPWQQSELFPLSVRSLGSSISTGTNWGSNTIVGLTFLPMMQALTPGWTFVCYAAVCVIGWISVWLIYPETAGLDLEDVSELLKDGWGVKASLERFRASKVLDDREDSED